MVGWQHVLLVHAPTTWEERTATDVSPPFLQPAGRACASPGGLSSTRACLSAMVWMADHWQALFHLLESSQEGDCGLLNCEEIGQRCIQR